MIKKFILIFIPCFLIGTLTFSKTTPKPKLTVAEIRKKKQLERAQHQAQALTHPHPNVLVKDMTESQLCDMIPYMKAVGDKESVFKVFHFLLSKSPDQNNLKTYKLELADYCFSIKEYEKAAFSYEEFFILYPGSAESEYSQYKAILCWFYQTLDSCKDQSNTEKTIILIDEYIRRANNQKFIDEVKTMRAQCRQKLFEYEMHIFEHYLKRKKHSSAQQRYEYIENNFKDIEHLDLYLSYCKKIQEIVKDPKKCPFLIKFNLKDALSDKKTKTTPENKAKTSLFFLS